jgi:DNA-directed RNA polymerase specialized sigma subunit
MNTEELLITVRNIDLQIDSKLAQVARLRELAEKITVTLSTQPKGTTIGKKTEECVLKIWELERSINADIDKLIDMKDTAKMLIDQIPDERYRLVLEYRYLKGMKWAKIAEKMGYDKRYLFKLHATALQSI